MITRARALHQSSPTARVLFKVLVVETIICVPSLAWNLAVRWRERHDFD